MEIWKDIEIPELPAIYQVSSYGKVRKRKGDGYVELKVHVHQHHNVIVEKGQHYRVDRLVYQAFGGGPLYKGCQLRHINGNPTDDRAENLIRVYPAIEKYTKNGELVKEYPSLKAAAEGEYMCIETMKTILKGGKNHLTEYVYRYKDERPYSGDISGD